LRRIYAPCFALPAAPLGALTLFAAPPPAQAPVSDMTVCRSPPGALHPASGTGITPEALVACFETTPEPRRRVTVTQAVRDWMAERYPCRT